MTFSAAAHRKCCYGRVHVPSKGTCRNGARPSGRLHQGLRLSPRRMGHPLGGLPALLSLPALRAPFEAWETGKCTPTVRYGGEGRLRCACWLQPRFVRAAEASRVGVDGVSTDHARAAVPDCSRPAAPVSYRSAGRAAGRLAISRVVVIRKRMQNSHERGALGFRNTGEQVRFEILHYAPGPLRDAPPGLGQR